MKNYSGAQFAKDVVAGIIVAIIALPLSIALAISSGVGPAAGIYTAIVAGFLVSFFGAAGILISMDWRFVPVLIAAGVLGGILTAAFRRAVSPTAALRT